MTKLIIFIVIGLLVSRECSPRSLPEEEDSVVSVYTTQASSPGARIDVYHQIANNIAERITSPVYKFLGIGKNTTQPTTTKRPWEKIELLEDGLEDSIKSITPISNDISNEKDKEELSPDAFKKIDKKPEKITLFSSYLPTIDANDTINEINDVETFGLDDVDDKNDGDDNNDDNNDDDNDNKFNFGLKDGPFTFILEMLASFATLVFGGIASLFSSHD